MTKTRRKQLKLSLEELYELSKDRPLSTPEIHLSNDYYGHAHLLKQYVNLSPNHQIKASIEHGVGIFDNVWDNDVKVNLPAILYPSSSRHHVFKKRTNKALFAIGSIISYAPSFLDREAFEQEKKSIGRNLLALPAHSTHWILSQYSIHEYCSFLEELGKDFDSVRVCLGWKDILRGQAEEFMKHGFECVTAGHMYDPLFLPRLRSIIELATVTTSNLRGTHVGYCILLGKSHYLSHKHIDVSCEKEEMLAISDYRNDSQAFQEILRACGEFREDVTPEQKAIAEKYWGTGEIKTVKEMRMILQMAEDMYAKGQRFYMSNHKVQIEQSLDYLNSTKNEEALIFLDQSVAVYPEYPAFNYGKAVALVRLGNISEAIKALDTLLTVMPDHKKAKLLLQELRIGIENENLLKSTDIMIASYPRSGNTWLRLLLADIILQIHNFKTDTVLPIHADHIIPNIHDKNLHEIDPRLDISDRLIKTHDTFGPDVKKVVYLFRNATDALSSYYYFHRRYQHLQNTASDGIDAFSIKHLEEWCEHLSSYVNAKTNQGADIFFISYEWLHTDAVGALRKVAKFLELLVSEQMCKIAVENHTFQKHHEDEKTSGTVGSKYFEYFFREGKIDGGAKAFQKETLEFINAKATPVYEKATALQAAEYPTQSPTISVEDLVKQVAKALQADNHTMAFHLINKAKSFKKPVQGLDYLRAICFLKMNQLDAAREALREELRYFSDNAEALDLLNQILEKPPQKISWRIGDQEFQELLQIIRPYTMLSEERLFSLFALAKRVCLENVPGNFVECGVAAGGSSALLAIVIKRYSRQSRRLYAFDSFEGMPAPSENDMHGGLPANATGWGTGTCAAPQESLREICAKLGVSEIVQTVKGYFQDTLPGMQNKIGQISFLHMDGDWYESTKTILNNLYDRTVAGGFIQVDDYGFWEGCSKAIHEFEAERDIKFQINNIDNTGVWFSKSDSFRSGTAIKDDSDRNIAKMEEKQAYASNGKPKKLKLKARLLNLGCGNRFHPDWTNVDFHSTGEGVISHNLTEGLTFADNSFDVVYHSHLLEHFPKRQAPVFLRECFRVMKDGGIIRVVIPDLEQIAKCYLGLLAKSLKGDKDARKQYEWTMLELFDQMVRNVPGGEILKYWKQDPIPAESFVIERMGSDALNVITNIRNNKNKHIENPKEKSLSNPQKIGAFRLSGEIHQWMYDRYSLGVLLNQVGFKDVKVCLANESHIPDFNSYLLDIEPDGAVRKPDSLFMEGMKY
jgi:predicted SAM-dependent methyltransferase/tetratricopeptide (TPR) repeat protein